MACGMLYRFSSALIRCAKSLVLISSWSSAEVDEEADPVDSTDAEDAGGGGGASDWCWPSESGPLHC